MKSRAVGVYAAGDIGFRRGLGLLLFGIAVEVGAIVLELPELTQATTIGHTTGFGFIGFIIAVVGGFFALAGTLLLAFPSPPRL